MVWVQGQLLELWVGWVKCQLLELWGGQGTGPVVKSCGVVGYRASC